MGSFAVAVRLRTAPPTR